MSYKPWNEITKTISRLSNEIKEYKCINTECNSKSFVDGKCSKCNTSNKEIFNKINQLEEYLEDIKRDYFKDGVDKTYPFLDQLYSLKNRSISFVDDFLDNINYEELRTKTIILLKQKYIDGTISKSEKTSLDSILLTKDKISQDELDLMHQMILNNDMSITLAKKYVIEFTKAKARELNIDYGIIGDKNLLNEYGKYDAITDNDDIYFDNKFIDRIFYINNFDIMYKTIFHELAHLKVNNDHYDNKINLASYKLAYDDVIKKNSPDLYEWLPYIFKSEIYADIRANAWFNRFQKSNGISPYDEEVHQKIKEQVNKFNTNDIKLNNYIVKYHDLAFKALIEHPEFYDEYEALHIEFKKIKAENGKEIIVRRSKEEIQEEIEEYNRLRNEVYTLKETYGIDNFKDLFINRTTKEVLHSMGITYDSFIEQSNRNRVRLDVLDSYKSESKIISSKSRGFSNVSILSFSIFIILLFGILFLIGLLIIK